ncbi:hypothetical protein Bca52824_063371 [Brassica carinata]|uniref:Uncharacterized protein n=1 Tax=Brassica carinata TaxID=52824 RepID=A0A8X7U947_BRACI|nr:hypothetical protein Bca52824_063371 [Brassica carinata]
MESGLLPAAEAKKVLEKKLQKTGKFSSPTKSAASTPRTASSTPRTSSKSVTEKKEVKKPASEAVSGKRKEMIQTNQKKRKKDSDDESDDDDFLASRLSNKKARAK